MTRGRLWGIPLGAVIDRLVGPAPSFPSISEEAGEITDTAFREAPPVAVPRGAVKIAKRHNWGQIARDGYRECRSCGRSKLTDEFTECSS